MISTFITILRMREPPKKTCIIMAVSSKPGSANSRNDCQNDRKDASPVLDRPDAVAGQHMQESEGQEYGAPDNSNEESRARE